MANQDSTQLLRTFYDAVNSHDIDRVISCFNSDGEFKTIAFDSTARGANELKTMIQGWYQAFPDMKIETSNINGTGDWAVAELTLKGTQRGPFQTPQGEIAPTNQHVQAPACDVVKFKNGKISSFHCYLESGTLMAQLGWKSSRVAA